MAAYFETAPPVKHRLTHGTTCHSELALATIGYRNYGKSGTFSAPFP
jgi:hypothetical protein